MNERLQHIIVLSGSELIDSATDKID